jgi:hypothetical protein
MGNVIKETPSPVWANFQQRALDVVILEINVNTDLKIKLVSRTALRANATLPKFYLSQPGIFIICAKRHSPWLLKVNCPDQAQLELEPRECPFC